MDQPNRQNNMINHFERANWVKVHGEPLIEKERFRIKYSNGLIRMFIKSSRQWLFITPSIKYGYIRHKRELDKGYVIVEKWLQEELNEAIAERILLGDE